MPIKGIIMNCDNPYNNSLKYLDCVIKKTATPLKTQGEYTVNTEEERLQLIADRIEKGKKNPLIRELTLIILRESNAKEKSDIDEIRAIFNWIKKNIAYRRDVACLDSYHDAIQILTLQSSDCDDFTILTDAMLGSVGFYELGARIMSSDINKAYHHIYPLVYARGYGWIPLDGSNKGYSVGQEPRYAKKKDYQFICGE